MRVSLGMRMPPLPCPPPVNAVLQPGPSPAAAESSSARPCAPPPLTAPQHITPQHSSHAQFCIQAREACHCLLASSHTHALPAPPLCLPQPQSYIQANTSSSEKPKSIPWKLLLSRKEVWAIIVCHFCHNWGTFILLTWMPTYYNQVGLGFGGRGYFVKA